MWNKFPALREASTKRMASNVANILDLDQLLHFTSCRCKNFLQKDCNEKSGGMAMDIQIDWANFHRDIWFQHLFENLTVIVRKDENGTVTLGIVEIDESLLAKAKCISGQWPEQRWVFGEVERQTGHCFMVEVPDR
eukprot:snap_masked-scaffold1630_size32793-processed-gene-0.4 protein:Tk02396 transcript:snap_masked-scaffold1630_size32793-processed-gene-0.4-mRNA-1 annotation:"hypothetical protein TcasGA2_TC010755"